MGTSMRNGFMGLALVVALGAFSSSARAVDPAKDLGEDVMKPMGADLQFIAKNIADATKNTDSLAALADVSAKIQIALVTVPDTQKYKAQVAQLGADAAFKKYTDLLDEANSEITKLTVTLSAAKANVCGGPCTEILVELKNTMDTAHNLFKDPHSN